MDENNGGCASDKSDSEVIEDCERELQQMTDWNSEMECERPSTSVKCGEKRLREKSDGSSEEGFVAVVRRKPKRLIQSDSTETINKDQNSMSNKCFEVCLTSLQILPKQMAFAKIMREENIKNITKIKYKSPYKVFIQFDDKLQAEQLINCQKITQLGIRSQFTDQGNLSYGLIRGIDLDMSEQEVLESLTSAFDIIALKRLKRMDVDGKWIDSETVRLCFNNPICPEHIFAYDCRFKVERYVFPVTQCSAGWKFGHQRKCPTNCSAQNVEENMIIVILKYFNVLTVGATICLWTKNAQCS